MDIRLRLVRWSGDVMTVAGPVVVRLSIVGVGGNLIRIPLEMPAGRGSHLDAACTLDRMRAGGGRER